MRWPILVAAFVLAGCDADNPHVPQVEDAQFYVRASVLNGADAFATNVDMTVDIRAAGCTGAVLQSMLFTQTGHGPLVAGHATAGLPSSICVTARSVPGYLVYPPTQGPPPAWAIVTTTRDSLMVRGGDTVEIVNRYDYSALSTEVMASNAALGSVGNISFELTTTDTAIVAAPAVRLAPFKVVGSTPVTLKARYETTNEFAEATLTRVAGRDTRVGFTVALTRADPTIGCFGCIAKVSVPVKTRAGVATGDSLSIIWGGGLPITVGAVF